MEILGRADEPNAHCRITRRFTRGNWYSARVDTSARGYSQVRAEPLHAPLLRYLAPVRALIRVTIAVRRNSAF